MLKVTSEFFLHSNIDGENQQADQNRELAGDTDAAANVKMPSRNEPVASAEEAKALIQSQRSCRCNITA